MSRSGAPRTIESEHLCYQLRARKRPQSGDSSARLGEMMRLRRAAASCDCGSVPGRGPCAHSRLWALPFSQRSVKVTKGFRSHGRAAGSVLHVVFLVPVFLLRFQQPSMRPLAPSLPAILLACLTAARCAHTSSAPSLWPSQQQGSCQHLLFLNSFVLWTHLAPLAFRWVGPRLRTKAPHCLPQPISGPACDQQQAAMPCLLLRPGP